MDGRTDGHTHTHTHTHKAKPIHPRYVGCKYNASDDIEAVHGVQREKSLLSVITGDLCCQRGRRPACASLLKLLRHFWKKNKFKHIAPMVYTSKVLNYVSCDNCLHRKSKNWAAIFHGFWFEKYFEHNILSHFPSHPNSAVTLLC